MACPGTRCSYARNVHAHGWPPARPCRGTSLNLGLPAAPVTPGPMPATGWEQWCRHSSPQLAGASPLPRADEANQGMKTGPWGFMSTPSPSWQSEGFPAPHDGAGWEAAPRDVSWAAHSDPAQVPPARPQPSHLCGNSPSFFTSQKGPGIADQGPLPSPCCNPRLNQESGKLRQLHGFLGIMPSSRQQ